MSDYRCPTCGQEWESKFTASGRRCPKCLTALLESESSKDARIASLESELSKARTERDQKEIDRQYHMNAINRLAKRIDALGETSDAVIEKAIRIHSDLTASLAERDKLWKLVNLGCGTVAEQNGAVMSMAEQRDQMACQLMEVREQAEKAGITLPDFKPLPWMDRIIARAEKAEAERARLREAVELNMCDGHEFDCDVRRGLERCSPACAQMRAALSGSDALPWLESRLSEAREEGRKEGDYYEGFDEGLKVSRAEAFGDAIGILHSEKAAIYDGENDMTKRLCVALEREFSRAKEGK